MTGLVPDGATLLRLVVPKPDFIGDDGGSAQWLSIKPSPTDSLQAAERGHPVRVSVWDVTRTTFEQATAFRRRNDCLPFTLTAADVREVGGEVGVDAMAAVYDPLDEPESQRPGADGHAGIEGLERGAKPNESKESWKYRLHLLARRLKPFNPPR